MFTNYDFGHFSFFAARFDISLTAAYSFEVIADRGDRTRILLILIGVSVLLATLFVANRLHTQTLTSQILESRASFVFEIGSQLRLRTQILDSRLVELLGKRDVQDLIRQRFDTRFDSLNAARRVQDDLRRIRLSEPWITTVGLYARDAGFILTDRVGFRTIETEMFPAVEMPDLQARLQPFVPHFQYDDPEPFFGITRTFPLQAPIESSVGGIFAEINLETLSRISSAQFSNPGTVIGLLGLYDESEAAREELILFETDTDLSISILQLYRMIVTESAARLQGSRELRIGTRRVGVAWYRIPELDWIVIGGVAIQSGDTAVQSLNLGFLLLGVAGAFITAFSFGAVSKFTVDPAFDFIKHVSTMLPVHTGAGSVSSFSVQLRALEAELTSLLYSSKTGFTEDAEVQRILKMHCIRAIMNGSDDPNRVLIHLRNAGMILPSACMAVIQLKILESDGSRTLQLPNQFDMLVNQIAAEHLVNGFRCIPWVGSDGTITLILGWSDRSVNPGESCVLIGEGVLNSLKAGLDWSAIFAGVSTAVYGPDEIPDCCRVAKQACEIAVRNRSRTVYTSSDIAMLAVDSSDSISSLTAIIQSITECVRDGARTRLRHAVAAFFDEATGRNVAFDSLQHLTSHLLMDCIHVAESMGAYVQTDARNETLKLWRDVGQASEIDEIRKIAGYAVELVASQIENVRNDRHVSSLVSKVTRFIEENYTNPNLSLSSIAEHFQISPPYLSRLYKERAGQKYIDHLSHVRVSAAKALLMSGGLSVAEVSSRVGYGSIRSFTRTFRSLTGCSPAEYRRVQMLENSTRDRNP